MNSALVLFAYFAMLLSPCIVATYGDLLSIRWIVALARRRRTHAAESFLVSFREERYAMAVAAEASFAAMRSAEFEAPRPFLVPRRYTPVETPAFLGAKQRVAARVAQLAVAQKLRHATQSTEKVVAIPADVESVEPVGVHIRPRRLEAAVAREAVTARAPYTPTHLVAREASAKPVPGLLPDRHPSLQEVVAASPGTPPVRSSTPADAAPRPRLHKPGESGGLEIAA